jgi:hypothetical protein
MTPEPSTARSSPRSFTLEDTWMRFGNYDKNAVRAQAHFTSQRKLILGLAVAAAVMAVTYSLLENDQEAINQSMAGFPQPAGPWLQQNFLNIFHGIVVLIPIVSAGLTAFALKFNLGVNWIMLRSSAEALKKEIYLYRMQVGDYSPDQTQTESRDVRLARKVKLISRRLMETQVNQTILEPYKDGLPPKFATSEGDDGFSDLTPEQYITYRVEDQFTYYQSKAIRFGRELQRFQLLVIVLGGVGTALAAFGLDIWITVSSALATAFASYLEFKRVETTVVSCNMAAADLYDIRAWWRALPEEAKAQQKTVETLVNSTESVIQSENAGWIQEMREALSEIYGDKKDKEEAVDYRSPETPISTDWSESPSSDTSPASASAGGQGTDSSDSSSPPSTVDSLSEPSPETPQDNEPSIQVNV